MKEKEKKKLTGPKRCLASFGLSVMWQVQKGVGGAYLALGPPFGLMVVESTCKISNQYN